MQEQLGWVVDLPLISSELLQADELLRQISVLLRAVGKWTSFGISLCHINAAVCRGPAASYHRSWWHKLRWSWQTSGSTSTPTSCCSSITRSSTSHIQCSTSKRSSAGSPTSFPGDLTVFGCMCLYPSPAWHPFPAPSLTWSTGSTHLPYAILKGDFPYFLLTERTSEAVLLILLIQVQRGWLYPPCMRCNPTTCKYLWQNVLVKKTIWTCMSHSTHPPPPPQKNKKAMVCSKSYS